MIFVGKWLLNNNDLQIRIIIKCKWFANDYVIQMKMIIIC